ncbi:hypothetical protein AAMO2058_000884000 [Amorphochlora amoebiformis]
MADKIKIEALQSRVDSLESNVGGPLPEEGDLALSSVLRMPQRGHFRVHMASLDSVGSRTSTNSNDSKSNLARQQATRERAILSLIRSLHAAMEKLEGTSQLRGLDPFLKKLDQLGYLIFPQGNISTQGIIDDLKVKEKRVQECIPMLEQTARMSSEMGKLKSVVKSDIPIDIPSFEQKLSALEASMGQRMEEALKIQAAVEELLTSYNAMMNAMTKKLLLWDSALTRKQINNL